MKTIQYPTQVRVLQGDNLRTIATRSLGDHTRWRELVELNQLRPPYIIESIDSADRLPNTLVWGDWISIPVPSKNQASLVFNSEMLGRDIKMNYDKTLPCSNGDFEVIAGTENLDQAVRHRFRCEKGNNFAHPKYGSDIFAAIGMKLMPIIEIFAAMTLKQTLLDDPRIARIANIKVTGTGDTLNCTAKAKVINENTDLDLNLSFPLLR